MRAETKISRDLRATRVRESSLHYENVFTRSRPRTFGQMGQGPQNYVDYPPGKSVVSPVNRQSQLRSISLKNSVYVFRPPILYTRIWGPESWRACMREPVSSPVGCLKSCLQTPYFVYPNLGTLPEVYACMREPVSSPVGCLKSCLQTPYFVYPNLGTLPEVCRMHLCGSVSPLVGWLIHCERATCPMWASHVV